MTTTDYTAPWSKLLWAFTTIGVGVLGGTILAAVLVPFPGSLALAVIAVVTLALCAIFAPRGYRLSGNTLTIDRMIGDNSVSLATLKAVTHGEDLIKGALRVGNGGLFAFSGMYWSRRHGWFHLSGTDILGRAVLLELEDAKWMITPGDPKRFVADARRLISTEAG